MWLRVQVRLALCQKGIPFQSIVHHYAGAYPASCCRLSLQTLPAHHVWSADKQEIAPFDQWPVLEHNGKRMDESLDIIGKRDQALLAGCLTSLTQALHAAYLDKEFPETPKLLSDSAHVQWAAHAEYAGGHPHQLLCRQSQPLLRPVVVGVAGLQPSLPSGQACDRS